jgi:hypothetical protein
MSNIQADCTRETSEYTAQSRKPKNKAAGREGRGGLRQIRQPVDDTRRHHHHLAVDQPS